MNMRSAAVALVVVSSLVVVGCEEKKPEAPKAAGTPAAPAAGNPVTDAAKGMTDKAKETAAGAATQAKEAVAKPVEEAKKAAETKVGELTQAAKDAFSGYMGEMGTVNGLLEKIKGPMDLTSAMPALSSSATKVNGYTSILNALSPEQKTSLIGDKKDALGSLTSTFKTQMERIAKDPMLSKLGDTLKGFKLFQ